MPISMAILNKGCSARYSLKSNTPGAGFVRPLEIRFISKNFYAEVDRDAPVNVDRDGVHSSSFDFFQDVAPFMYDRKTPRMEFSAP